MAGQAQGWRKHVSRTAEFGLAGMGKGERGLEVEDVRKAAPDRPYERVREGGLSAQGNGEPQKALEQETGHSNGHVCVEGNGKVEAGWPASRRARASALQREEQLMGRQPKERCFNPESPAPTCGPSTTASQRARSRASSASRRETSSSWTTTQESRS